MITQRSILLVEDNEDDAFLMQRALQEAAVANPMLMVEDGQQAIDYLSGAGKYADREKFPVPAVVFLDLKLPYKTGHDVLTWIRQQKELEGLVVIVLTSSAEPSDIKKSYSLGANSYLVKPPTSQSLLDLAKSFKWYWLTFNQYSGAKPV